MSTADTDLHADWRGVATEDADELPSAAGAFLRGRPRRLLADLLRPHRRALWLLLVDDHRAEPGRGWPARC